MHHASISASRGQKFAKLNQQFPVLMGEVLRFVQQQHRPLFPRRSFAQNIVILLYERSEPLAEVPL